MAVVLAALALGAHRAEELQFVPFWSILGGVVHDLGGAMVLLIASLTVLGISRRWLRAGAVVAAVAVLAGGLAYSIWLADFAIRDSSLLFVSSVAGNASLALVIVVAGRGIDSARFVLAAAAAVFVASAVSEFLLLGQSGAAASIWLLLSQVGGTAFVVLWWLVLEREDERLEAAAV